MAHVQRDRARIEQAQCPSVERPRHQPRRHRAHRPAGGVIGRRPTVRPGWDLKARAVETLASFPVPNPLDPVQRVLSFQGCESGPSQKHCENRRERLYKPRISHFGGSKTTARAGTRANEKDF
ncbi:hypothetical protein MPL3356_40456 [Mesorhizobium plurifarium]|uniref:Uncharacterized protein n=1 Tax=Mesorhizobium plurifarium TaxID=69974 RepID=A0A090E2D2_MESPL|nr:hypothetical protein MPL3356_40456 [Mesorhizobium plurifarium]